MASIEVVRGDITTIECDAIVNAANTSLLGGGGVDGAIHRAAGPELLAECRGIVARQGGCDTGQAVITGAGNLSARFVIHTVGPIWNDAAPAGELDDLLADCYRNSLRLAADHDVATIAFPNISTGVYRFPKPRAAEIAVESVNATLAELGPNCPVARVLFVCFDDDNAKLYESLLR